MSESGMERFLGGGVRWLQLAYFAICSLTVAGEVGAVCAPGEPAR